MAFRVLHVGLGPIGIGVVKQVASRKGFTIVGAVDIDPAKVGQDLGEVAGAGPHAARAGDRGHGRGHSQDEAGRGRAVHQLVARPGHAADRSHPQVEGADRLDDRRARRIPRYSNKRLAKKIDELAKKAGVAVLGTGVNPGFVMDALPITLTGVCERVEAVHVDRIQDASIRRLPFQQKIGSGLTPAQFQAKVDAGTVRHVGLTESIAMIADALGWKLDRITDEIQPKIAARPVSSQFLTVKKGQVCGIIQDGVGYRQGEPVITLHMEAYLGRARVVRRGAHRPGRRRST